MTLPQPVAITGGRGRIGTILRRGLSGYKISSPSKTWLDLRNYHSVHRFLKYHSAVIHLAWDIPAENYDSDYCSADNTSMFFNVFRAALEHRIKRVIMASSVHADNFYDWDGPGLMSADRLATPVTAYGAHKLFMESLGSQYSRRGLEVVCVRFGSVNADDKPPHESRPRERAVYLSHRDCLDLIATILEAKEVPNGFSVIYGVSDTPFRIHDINNPFGWKSIPVML